MKALCWQGKGKVRVENVPDPKILNPHDAVIKVTATAICGSDLHLYDGYIPTMESGDILGHEFMGEVVETGREVKSLKAGDKVVVPFTISCGHCFFCERDLWSLCDNTNPNAWMNEAMNGANTAGLFGYSHLYGGYAGGQAEYVRVPFADVGPLKVPHDVPDEKVLFLSDIFPTAWQAAENANITKGDIVAIWGAGPVGLLAVKSALLLGAERVVSIDCFPNRLQRARDAGAETINFREVDVYEALNNLTGGRGPDGCIDCVGLEAYGHTIDAMYDYAKAALFLATDRIHALRQAIRCCRKGGTVSIPGVYGGLVDKFPLGAAFAKGLTFKMGQTHMQRLMKPLLERILHGDIDPSFIISHRLQLDDAADGYASFKQQQNEVTKIVMRP